MKEFKTDFVSSASFDDPRFRFRFKLQTLMQEYQELRKETEFKMRKLEMMKQKRLTLDAEVRFLRRRYKHLKQDQTHQTTSYVERPSLGQLSSETDPKVLRLSESGDLEVPCKPSLKRKKHSASAYVPGFDLKQKNTICIEKEALASNASCDLEKNPKRSRGNEVMTNPIPLPDLNGDENTFVNNKVPGFDLNQISREEEEPEANGEHMVAEATKKAMVGDLHGELKLPICRDVEKELNRAVKRKVSWQDPVALSV